MKRERERTRDRGEGGVNWTGPLKGEGQPSGLRPPGAAQAQAGSRNSGRRAGAPGSRAGARGRSTCGGRRRALRPAGGR